MCQLSANLRCCFIYTWRLLCDHEGLQWCSYSKTLQQYLTNKKGECFSFISSTQMYSAGLGFLHSFLHRLRQRLVKLTKILGKVVCEPDHTLHAEWWIFSWSFKHSNLLHRIWNWITPPNLVNSYFLETSWLLTFCDFMCISVSLFYFIHDNDTLSQRAHVLEASRGTSNYEWLVKTSKFNYSRTSFLASADVRKRQKNFNWSPVHRLQTGNGLMVHQ